MQFRSAQPQSALQFEVFQVLFGLAQLGRVGAGERSRLQQSWSTVAADCSLGDGDLPRQTRML